MAIKRISEGMTNTYLVQGVGVLVLGVACFWLSPFIALPVLILAVGLLAAETGVILDTDEKQYKNYMSLFGFKIGKWHSFKTARTVILILSSENATVHGMTPGIGIARSASVKIRTYDVLFVDASNTPQIMNDFSTYKTARSAFKHLEVSLGVTGRDYVAEKLAANRSKRSR